MGVLIARTLLFGVFIRRLIFGDSHPNGSFYTLGGPILGPIFYEGSYHFGSITIRRPQFGKLPNTCWEAVGLEFVHLRKDGGDVAPSINSP